MRYKDPLLKERIKSYVEKYFFENRKAPSLRHISEKLNIGKTTVYRYLTEMNNDGVLEYNGLEGTSTELTKKISDRCSMVAILGCISCGIPKFAEENIETYIEMPRQITGEGDFYILRAYGDSMTGVNINNGDYVLIRKTNVAREGEIVVALIDDEATLKTYYLDKENNRIRLHPENRKFKDIYSREVIIQGVAVTVFKDLRTGRKHSL